MIISVFLVENVKYLIQHINIYEKYIDYIYRFKGKQEYLMEYVQKFYEWKTRVTVEIFSANEMELFLHLSIKAFLLFMEIIDV